MPYDPDFDDAEAHTDSCTLGGLWERRSLSFDEAEEEWSHDQDENVSADNDAEAADLMDVDLAREPSSPPAPRVASVAVILHSTPQKGDYARIADDMDDSMRLITSDLLPDSRPRQQSAPIDIPAPVASVGAARPQSVPFPVPEITPQPKKRGRPFGWRPGSGPYSAGRAKPADRPRGRPGRPPGKMPKTPKLSGDGKRRGRPAKNPPPSPWEIYINSGPKFPVFLCEWEGCPAELHNLETLRRHLIIVHGKAAICKWGSCAAKHPEPLAFTTRADFEAHLDKTHIPACAWHLGDGPCNHSGKSPRSDPPDKLPDYLFDKSGKQITPWVANLEIEDDEARKKRKMRLARLIMQRDNNAAPEPSYTAQDWVDIADALNAKRKKQRMLREYHAAICGTENHPPRYGPEWRGLLMKDGSSQD